MLRLCWAIPSTVLAGVMLDVAYPAVGLWPAAFVAVVLTLMALRGRSVLGAILIGTVFGVVFFAIHLSWVGEFLGPLPWVALVGLEGALVAAGSIAIALAYRWTEKLGVRARFLVRPGLVAGLWSAREMVAGTWPYSGFPWARVATSQANGPFAEAVSWIGVDGVSFAIVAVCALTIECLWARRFRMLALPVSLACALALIPAFPTRQTGQMAIGWVQANGPSGYFDDRSPGEILELHEARSEALYGRGADLIVWPEGAVDSDPYQSPQTARRLDAVVRAADAPLLANAAVTRSGETYNTSFLWGTGDSVQYYDKRHPVPFGEYVPDRAFYERLVPGLVGLIQREYTAGRTEPVLDVDGVRIGVGICFDLIYDDVIRAGAEGGAEVYIFQTNNADFRGTDENLQQMAIARLRAFETGRAVVNVSTTGTSQVVLPDGSVIDAAAPGESAASVSDVPLYAGRTPAVVIGSIPIAGLAVLAICTLISLGLVRLSSRSAAAERKS
ncbi:apolipoprotein N-acyltransferase [Microbacterium nanhaiense]|uniref:Apolipoprotein N-acyltransferase n=2 Tax=Microbacterium nanhaiense TaxID=1301026 RepID=A0ABQ2MXL2_9MICO|nr:apolipoprotein N-acyltransferase [Microbacterium nanhaiense]